jgi:hypothetical protein
MFKQASFTASNDSYILSSEKGQANGIATLDVTGKVSPSQLPQGTAAIYSEDLTAQINGITRTFTTSNQFALTTTKIIYCGIELRRGALNDYTETDNFTLQFSASRPIPTSGDTLIVYYNQP